MRSIFAWCLVLLLPVGMSCSALHKKHYPQKEPTAETSDLTTIETKRALYEQTLVRMALPFDGWIAQTCDALLFSSLFGAAEQYPDRFKVDDAVGDKPGLWLRRPKSVGLCYDPSLPAGSPQNSQATISKDMLLGLTYYAWRANRKDILQNLVTYGEAHAWVMGQPESNVGAVVVTPSLAGVMYQALYRLGGPDHPSRHIPDIFPSGLTGFEAHLQVTSILLHSEIDDEAGISQDMLDRLKEHATREPQNPYYASALAVFTGDDTAAVKLLMDKVQWPDDRLPDGGDHCEPWVIQRDGPNDWNPCKTQPIGTFWGADYVWTVDILTRPRRVP